MNANEQQLLDLAIELEVLPAELAEAVRAEREADPGGASIGARLGVLADGGLIARAELEQLHAEWRERRAEAGDDGEPQEADKTAPAPAPAPASPAPAVAIPVPTGPPPKRKVRGRPERAARPPSERVPSRRKSERGRARPAPSGISPTLIAGAVAGLLILAVGLMIALRGEDPAVVAARKLGAVKAELDRGALKRGRELINDWRSEDPGADTKAAEEALETAIKGRILEARSAMNKALAGHDGAAAEATLAGLRGDLPDGETATRALALLTSHLADARAVLAAIKADKALAAGQTPAPAPTLKTESPAAAALLAELAKAREAEGDKHLLVAAKAAERGAKAEHARAMRAARAWLAGIADEKLAAAEDLGRQALEGRELTRRVSLALAAKPFVKSALVALRGELTAADVPLSGETAKGLLGSVDEALREVCVTEIRGHIAAGRKAEARAAFEAFRAAPWAPEPATVEDLKGEIANTGKDPDVLARAEFEKLRERVEAAFRERDWETIKAAVKPDAEAKSLIEPLACLRIRIAEVLSLRRDAMAGYLKLKGSMLEVTRRSGGRVRGRVVEVDPEAYRITFAVGGGQMDVGLDELHHDDIAGAALAASDFRRRTMVRIALLALGDGAREKALQVLTRFRDLESVAKRILADLEAREGRKATPARPGRPKGEGARPKPQGRGTPKGAEPEMLAALKIYHAGRLALCMRKVTAWLEDHPDSASAWLLYGWLEYDYGRYESAMEKLDKAVKLDPDLEFDRLDIQAKIQFLRGQDEAMKKTLAKLPKISDAGRSLPHLSDPEGLSSIRSKDGHYIVYVDDALKRRGGHKYAARLLDLIYKAYSRVFPFKTDKTVIHRCYILSTQAGYLEFCAKLGTDGRGSAGFFTRETRVLIINADPRQDEANPQGFTADAVDTIFHEGFHQFIHNSVPDMPLWFNEGLAEYFGPSILLDSKRLRVGTFVRSGKVYPSRFEIIKEAIDSSSALSLRSFMSQTDAQFMQGGARTSINYAQSWAVMHFLLHDPRVAKKGRKVIREYFTKLKEGSTKDEAFKETFGKLDLLKLDAAWKSYIRSL